MSLLINTHEFHGTVIAKNGPYVINENMNKSYLYVKGMYIVSGKERQEEVKFVVFSWGDNPSRVANVFPGDEIKFKFNLSGRISQDKKGKFGELICFTEAVVASKIEILNTSQRKLYDNRDEQPTPQAAPPKFQYGNDADVIEKEDGQLPF